MNKLFLVYVTGAILMSLCVWGIINQTTLAMEWAFR